MYCQNRNTSLVFISPPPIVPLLRVSCVSLPSPIQPSSTFPLTQAHPAPSEEAKEEEKDEGKELKRGCKRKRGRKSLREGEKASEGREGRKERVKEDGRTERSRETQKRGRAGNRASFITRCSAVVNFDNNLIDRKNKLMQLLCSE